MRQHRYFPLAVLIAALALSPGLGQEPKQGEGRGPVRGGPSAFATLRQKAVMDELKFSEAQRGKMKETLMALREKMLDFIENKDTAKAAAVFQEQEKAIFKLLTPEQGKRLNELVHQIHGLWAMTIPDTSRELKLTPEQTKQLQELQKETEARMKKLFQGEAETRTEAQKKLGEMHVAATEKGLTLLTEDQRTKWKTLAGAPFKGEITRVAPGGGRPEK